MRIIFIIVIFKLITNTSFGQTSEPIEYNVYSTIIDSFNEECLEDWQRKRTKKIIINSSSDFYNTFKKDNSYLENLKYFCHSCVDWIDNQPRYDSVLIDLILKLDTVNKSKLIFENQFKIKKFKTIILPDKKFNSYFTDDKDEGWNKFYLDYPKSIGYMTLSKIAYSTDKKLCTIYIDLRFGSLGAVGYILLLNTKNYKIIKKEMLWQS